MLSSPETRQWWRDSRIFSLGLFALALFLWGINLGELPLKDWDEGIYAGIAKSIYQSGQWLYPTLNGNPYLNKPPLLEWAIASSYTLFGTINEFTTRFPAAFLSAIAVPLLYGVGRELFPNQRAALFSAGVYLTLLPVVRHGRLAMRDGMIVTFLLLLLWCLLKARQDRRWALGVGIGLGLLCLTKSILVLLLGAIALVFLIVDRQFALLKSGYLWSGLLLGMAPAIAWYVAQYQHYGLVFLQVHFLSQSFSRVWESVNQNAGPPWYYLLEVLKYAWPWLLFTPAGLGLAWQKRQTSWSRLVGVGLSLYLVAISVMTTKLPWYVIPVYPFLALAIGAALDQQWQQPPTPKRGLAGWFGLLAIAGLAGGLYIGWADTQPILGLLGVVLAITFGGTAYWLWQGDRRFIGLLFAGCYLSLTLLMSSPLWLWELNEAYPVKPVAALIKTNTPAGATVYTSFPNYRPSLDFYSDRSVLPKSLPELQNLGGNQAYLLLDQAALTQLQLLNTQTLGTAEGFTLVVPMNPIESSAKS